MVVVYNFMIQKILQPHGISTNLEDYFFSALFFKSWFGAAHRVVGHKLSIISLHVTIFRRSSSVGEEDVDEGGGGGGEKASLHSIQGWLVS